MKTLQQSVLCGAMAIMLWGTGCRKENLFQNLSTHTISAAETGFVQFVVPKGAHAVSNNPYQGVDVTELKFTVRFDSSCIYQTILPENQWDINKLYGFSDNGAMHHQYSARFGWRWSEGALRLFAYIYDQSVRHSKELASIPIGKEVHCSIKVLKQSYVFSVGEQSVTMPRSSTTPTAKGYKLYPYFGGDEVAPHEIRIWIKEVK